MASRRLRRLKMHSFWARRRMIRAALLEEQLVSGALGSSSKRPRLCFAVDAKQAQEATTYEVDLEAEKRQLEALGAPESSTEEEDDADDEEEEEEEENEDADTCAVSGNYDEEVLDALPPHTDPKADLPKYGSGAKFWDLKHAEDKHPYEWMQSYDDFKKIIAKCTSRDRSRKILHVGCGSSLLTEEMYDDGYHDIVNIDISSIVIEKMRARNTISRPNMKWLAMDATAMKFENGAFDIVLDKCTIDTLVCCNDADAVVGKYLEEVARVLRVNGIFLAFSFGKPETRAPYLRHPHLCFGLEIIKVPVPYTKTKFHFAYACRKGASMS